MSDPILDEIRRVRKQLLKEHGGLTGYLAHVKKLDRAHRRRGSSTRGPGRSKSARKS